MQSRVGVNSLNSSLQTVHESAIRADTAHRQPRLPIRQAIGSLGWRFVAPAARPKRCRLYVALFIRAACPFSHAVYAVRADIKRRALLGAGELACAAPVLALFFEGYAARATPPSCFFFYEPSRWGGCV